MNGQMGPMPQQGMPVGPVAGPMMDPAQMEAMMARLEQMPPGPERDRLAAIMNRMMGPGQ